MYEVVFTRYFKRQLKELVKKNRHLEPELRKVLAVFRKDTAISIGKRIFKIRLRAQNKSKSGSYRVYLLVLELNSKLTPLCIYAKNERKNLTRSELIGHLEKVSEELTNINL